MFKAKRVRISLLQICFWQPVSSTHPRDLGYNLSALEIHSFKRADRSFRSSTVWACCDRRMLLQGTCQVPHNNILLVREQTRESLDGTSPVTKCKVFLYTSHNNSYFRLERRVVLTYGGCNLTPRSSASYSSLLELSVNHSSSPGGTELPLGSQS